MFASACQPSTWGDRQLGYGATTTTVPSRMACTASVLKKEGVVVWMAGYRGVGNRATTLRATAPSRGALRHAGRVRASSTMIATNNAIGRNAHSIIRAARRLLSIGMRSTTAHGSG